MSLLPSATKLRQGNVFSPVCDSVHRGGGLCPGGVSVQSGYLCPGGVFVQGGLCPGPGGLCPGGSLSGSKMNLWKTTSFD